MADLEQQENEEKELLTIEELSQRLVLQWHKIGRFV